MGQASEKGRLSRVPLRLQRFAFSQTTFFRYVPTSQPPYCEMHANYLGYLLLLKCCTTIAAKWVSYVTNNCSCAFSCDAVNVGQ